MTKDDGITRAFDTGATRDSAAGKYDYEGFLSPLVLKRYARYMHKHRFQSDGKIRDSDNWQKGIPQDVYIKSAFRHFMDWWLNHRGQILQAAEPDVEEVLCALLFNVSGYLHESLSSWRQPIEKSLPDSVEDIRQKISDEIGRQDAKGDGIIWVRHPDDLPGVPPHERVADCAGIGCVEALPEQEEKTQHEHDFQRKPGDWFNNPTCVCGAFLCSCGRAH